MDLKGFLGQAISIVGESTAAPLARRQNLGSRMNLEHLTFGQQPHARLDPFAVPNNLKIIKQTVSRHLDNINDNLKVMDGGWGRVEGDIVSLYNSAGINI